MAYDILSSARTAMDLEVNQPPGADVKALLEENLRYAKAIYASTEKTRRYIFWGQVFGFLKIVLIVAPLVIAFWYLRPMLQQALAAYQQLLGDSAGTASGNTNSSFLDQLKNFRN